MKGLGILNKISVPVMPVCVFKKVDSALRVCELLLKNRFEIIEITLRTEEALECIEAVSREFPELLLGAGTVLEKNEIDMIAGCGVSYAVSPCFERDLALYSREKGIDFVPGVATPSEFYQALKVTDTVKIFPAENLGGAKFIKSLSAPFKKIRHGIIPTGGVNEKNFMEYLSLENVSACGMSWPVDGKLVESGNYREIDNRLRFILEELDKGE